MRQITALFMMHVIDIVDYDMLMFVLQGYEADNSIVHDAVRLAAAVSFLFSKTYFNPLFYLVIGHSF